MFQLMSWMPVQNGDVRKEISGPPVQLFLLHKLMKYFGGENAKNSVEKNTSLIVKAWQMVNAGKCLACSINTHRRIALNTSAEISAIFHTKEPFYRQTKLFVKPNLKSIKDFFPQF